MPNELDIFVEEASERQAETEVVAERNIKEVQDIYLELLNNPGRRNAAIWDWFLQGEILESNKTMDAASLDAYLEELSELVDMKFDDLQSMPVAERDAVWDAAEQIMSAAASRQARIESGLVLQALKDGIENGLSLARESKKITPEQLKNISGCCMQQRMKEKKKAKRNAAKSD
jgi:hypothetical protein